MAELAYERGFDYVIISVLVARSVVICLHATLYRLMFFDRSWTTVQNSKKRLRRVDAPLFVYASILM